MLSIVEFWAASTAHVPGNPARPVPTVSLHCALSYGELVHSSLHELQRAAPTARLVWRTTNAVCDSGFVGDWHDVIHAYSGSGSASYQLPSARRVRERCTRRYNVSEAVCEQTVMNRQNTLAQQRLAQRGAHAGAPSARGGVDAGDHPL